MNEWKETEFGRIPSDWGLVKSNEFCLGIADGTHDSPKRKDEGHYLITSKHIKGRNIDFENAYLISKEDFDKINQRSRVDQWDVIISMIGEYCGFCYIERNEHINYAVKNVGLFKLGNETKAFWLYYYLNSRVGRYFIDVSKSGTSQPYLSLGVLRDFPILIPSSKEEQKAITGVLSSLDDKIDLLHRQNETLEAMAQTLFRQWFVEEAGDDWDERSLYDAINLIGGGTPKTSEERYWNGNIPWLSGADVSGNHKGFVLSSAKRITEARLNNSSTKLLPQFSTVISARGTVGKYCLLARPMAFSQTSYGITPCFEDSYFFTYLLIDHSVNALLSAAYGSVFDTITTRTFQNFVIHLPPEDEILYFEQKVRPYFLRMKLNKDQIHTLEKVRDTLLPKLMSGKVRVQI